MRLLTIPDRPDFMDAPYIYYYKNNFSAKKNVCVDYIRRIAYDSGEMPLKKC